jgi:PRC-barrel domain
MQLGSQIRAGFLIGGRAIRMPVVGSGVFAACLIFIGDAAAPAGAIFQGNIVVAQAMVPPTGMDDAEKPMPMDERMSRRFPQPVRVGDLVGLPMLDDRASTIGHVRQVVRTAQDKIKLIVSCGGWLGLGARLVAVPIEVVGIEGRQLVSLDMPRSEYAAAPTWHATDDAVLPGDATIRIALARN